MKLCQTLAIESGVKNKAQKELTALHRSSEKNDLYLGISRKYTPNNDDGDKFPDETQHVQQKSTDVLAQIQSILTESFDIELTKDAGNLIAKANVVVDGRTILSDVPVSFLLYLEKQLEDLNTIVTKMPTLDPSEEWTLDTTTNLHRTVPVKTLKTKKIMVPVVLYPATVEHPAQVKEMTEDQIIGTWATTKFSGALTEGRKREVLGRIVALQQAVKCAREEANSTVVEKQTVAGSIFNFLLSRQA